MCCLSNGIIYRVLPTEYVRCCVSPYFFFLSLLTFVSSSTFFVKLTENHRSRLGFFSYSVVMTAGEPRVEEAC